MSKTESLFHYTTKEGLEGILKTQSLWATDFRYLNDTNELKAIQPILKYYISQIVRQTVQYIIKKEPAFLKRAQDRFGTLEDSIIADVKVIIESMYEPFNQDKTGVFILSLCKNNNHVKNAYNDGLLSMWRAYGGAQAYAIEFEKKKLDELIQQDCNEFEYTIPLSCDVEYEMENIPQSEKETLKEFCEKIVRGIILNHIENLTVEEVRNFLFISASLKHYAFSEENEFRYVFYIQNYDELILLDKEQKLKRKKIIHNDNKKPRIHLFEGLNKKLPIKRIIVGPHENKANIEEELKGWLKQNALDIPVTVSEIPFRGMK